MGTQTSRSRGRHLVTTAGLALAGFMGMYPAQLYAQAAATGAGTADAVAPASDDIIVSARRRNEGVQETPVAVTALSPAQITATGAFDFTSLQGMAPNLLITRQSTGGAAANMSIRGIGFADVEKSFDPSVGVMIDGVYIGTSTGQVLDTFDLESIEVLRGPQGTLFGRNTIAGVINARRTRPTGHWGAKIEASVGSYNSIQLKGVVNAPLIPDVLALKVFALHQEDGGFLHNFYDPKQRLGAQNSENYGLALLYTPSSRFDALLTLEAQDQNFESYFGLLARPDDVYCSSAELFPAEACGQNNTTDVYTVFKPSNLDFGGTYKARAATLEANYDADVVKLTSVTSYRSSTERQTADFGSIGLYWPDRQQKYHQFSEELRAAGKIFPGMDYVAGLYYFDSWYRIYRPTYVSGALASAQFTVGKAQSLAAFADLNWEFAPHFRLSGGGRFTHDKKQLFNREIFNPVTGAQANAQKSWSKFTPKISIDWRPTSDLMAYATWSRGYRSGGFNGRAETYVSVTTPFDPETVDSYEVGFKSELFDRKVTLNVAGFYTNYKNMQQSSTVSIPGGLGNETLIVNVGSSKIRGIEGELNIRPMPGLTLSLNGAYTKSNFKNFIVDQLVFGELRRVDYSNVNLIYAPKVTFSANAQYTLPLDDDNALEFSAGYRYLSPYDQQVNPDRATTIPATGVITVNRNDPLVRTDGQNLVDASLSYVMKRGDGSKVRLTGFVRNLLDDRGMASAFMIGSFPGLWTFASAREPRVYGARIGVEF